MTENDKPLLIEGARVVTASEVLETGLVLIDSGKIVAVLEERAQAVRLSPLAKDMVRKAHKIDLGGGYLIPGLIDLHVHGGNTATFDEGTDAVATAVAAHRRRGTTSTMVSLITGQPDAMFSAIAGAAAAAHADPRIVGIHLEGPFLSPLHRGAHDPAALIDPDLALFDEFLTTGDGHIRMITIAPERPGGLDLVRAAVAHQVHAAVGHTDADYDTARAAFDAGADIVTHAFNAMRPIHHRNPGVIPAARNAGVVLEAINDGVHLHNATVSMLAAMAHDRVVFVTDAMAAACAADGSYQLGPLAVTVTDGVARLVTDDGSEGSIAGSTLTMDTAVRRAVLDVGLPIVDAVAAATRIPAQFLGLGRQIGSIMPGLDADLVIVDDAWDVRGVLLNGQWADERRPGTVIHPHVNI